MLYLHTKNNFSNLFLAKKLLAFYLNFHLSDFNLFKIILILQHVAQVSQIFIILIFISLLIFNLIPNDLFTVNYFLLLFLFR